MTSEQALRYILEGISDGSIYALVAIGFNIIYNSTGIINFTQGEFVVLGGLTTSVLVMKFAFPIPLAIMIAVLIAVLIAAIFERTAIYPMRNASVLTLVIITIGGAITLRGIIMITLGKNPLFMRSFSKTEVIRIMGFGINTQTIWIFGTMVVLAIALALFFKITITGKAMRACSFNPSAALLSGIHVKKMVLLSFIIGAAIAALGGAVLIGKAPMDYHYGPLFGLKGFAAAVLGGLGKGGGAVVGGLVIGLTENFAKHVNSDFKDAISIFILVLMLFIKPSGILGKKSEETHKKV